MRILDNFKAVFKGKKVLAKPPFTPVNPPKTKNPQKHKHKKPQRARVFPSRMACVPNTNVGINYKRGYIKIW